MPSNYTKLATAYRNLNRLDEAKATIQAGLKNIAEGENAGADFELLRYFAIIQNDQKAEQQARGIVQQNPQQKQFLTILDANLAAARGRMKESRQLFSKARETAVQADSKEYAAFLTGLLAVNGRYSAATVQRPGGPRARL